MGIVQRYLLVQSGDILITGGRPAPEEDSGGAWASMEKQRRSERAKAAARKRQQARGTTTKKKRKPTGPVYDRAQIKGFSHNTRKIRNRINKSKNLLDIMGGIRPQVPIISGILEAPGWLTWPRYQRF